MKQAIQLHNELLSPDELRFLVEKDGKETRNFYKAISIFMVICFIIPFAIAWYKAIDGEEYAFSYTSYFLGVGYLLAFLGVGAWFAYRRTLYKIKKDIHHRSKTVERTHITRKQYMPHNHIEMKAAPAHTRHAHLREYCSITGRRNHAHQHGW